MNREEAIRVLGEVYSACSKVFPCEIHDAYLYGSFARGDYHEDSDVDIFLALDMDWEELAKYRPAAAHIASELGLRYDTLISISLSPLKLFVQYADDLPFYRNIRAEGVRYVA